VAWANITDTNIPESDYAKARTDAKAASVTSAEAVGGSLPLSDEVYFTAGIADKENNLFGLITEDER